MGKHGMAEGNHNSPPPRRRGRGGGFYRNECAVFFETNMWCFLRNEHVVFFKKRIFLIYF